MLLWHMEEGKSSRRDVDEEQDDNDRLLKRARPVMYDPEKISDLLLKFPYLIGVVFEDQVENWKAKIIEVSKDASLGLVQPTRHKCLREVARRIFTERSISLDDQGALEAFIDSALRPVALGITSADLADASVAKVQVSSPTHVELTAVPMGNAKLQMLHRRLEKASKSVIQALVKRHLNWEHLLDIFITVIHWSRESPNVFLPDETSKTFWIWSGQFWYERNALNFMATVIDFAVKDASRDEGTDISFNQIKQALAKMPFASTFLWNPTLYRVDGSWIQVKNQHPGYILSKSGMINLMTGVEEKFASKFFVCGPCFTEYPNFDLNHETPFMNERMDEFFDGNKNAIDSLRWHIGASLFGNPNLNKKFLWFHGRADSAKSFLQSCLRFGLSHYVAVGDTKLLTCVPRSAAGHTGNMFNLFGKRIVIFDEIDAVKNGKFLKEMMSNAEVTARNARATQSPPIRLSVVPFIFSNFKPNFDDPALIEKVVVVPMTRSFGSTHENSSYLKRTDVTSFLSSPQGKDEAFNWLVQCGMFFCQNMFKEHVFPMSQSAGSSFIEGDAIIIFRKIMADYAKVHVSPPFNDGTSSMEAYKATTGELFGISYDEFRCVVRFIAQRFLGLKCHSFKSLVTEVAKLLASHPGVFVIRDKESRRFWFKSVLTQRKEFMDKKCSCIINLEWTETGQELVASLITDDPEHFNEDF